MTEIELFKTSITKQKLKHNLTYLTKLSLDIEKKQSNNNSLAKVDNTTKLNSDEYLKKLEEEAAKEIQAEKTKGN